MAGIINKALTSKKTGKVQDGCQVESMLETKERRIPGHYITKLNQKFQHWAGSVNQGMALFEADCSWMWACSRQEHHEAMKCEFKCGISLVSQLLLISSESDEIVHSASPVSGPPNVLSLPTPFLNIFRIQGSQRSSSILLSHSLIVFSRISPGLASTFQVRVEMQPTFLLSVWRVCRVRHDRTSSNWTPHNGIVVHN